MKLRVSYLFFALGCVLISLVAAQILLPGEVTLANQYGDASVQFSSDRRSVFAMGDCVSLTWNAEGIREIYLDEVPTTGTNGQRYCIGDTMPTLRVVYQDGVTQTFTLPILFVIDRVEVWLVMLGMVFVWITGAVIFALEHRRTQPAAPNTAKVSQPHRITVFGVVGGIVIIFAGLYLAGELMLRLYFGVFGTEAQRMSFVYSRDELNRAHPQNIVLPVVGYTLSPYNPIANDLGYKSEDIVVPKPDGVFRIVAIGGSSTFGFTPPDLTYPAQLQRFLREEYGYTNVEVVNAGIPGYTTFQSVPNFITRVLAIEPDMIIFNEATNDVDPRKVDPECYSGMTPLLGTDPRGSIPTDATNSRLSPSVLYRFISIELGWEDDPSEGFAYRRVDVDCQSSTPRTPEENVASNPPIYYRRNLITLIAVAQANHVQVMFSTWAYNESSDEALPYWRTAIAEHNQIVTELAADYDLLYIDYAPLAPQEDSAWSDYVHMGVEGSRHQAETYAAFIAESGVIPPPG